VFIATNSTRLSWPVESRRVDKVFIANST